MLTDDFVRALWQKSLAAYFCVLDVLLCCQYYWYTSVRPRRRDRATQDDGQDGDQPVIQTVAPIAPDVAQNAVQVNGDASDLSTDLNKNDKAINIPWKWFHRRPHAPDPPVADNRPTRPAGRTIIRPKRSQSLPLSSPRGVFIMSIICVALTTASPIQTPYTESTTSTQHSDLVGGLVSWISAICYLASRFPQIYKNSTRKSTEGLAPGLFGAAFCGNVLYSTSLGIDPLAWHSYPPHGLHGAAGPAGSDQQKWLIRKIPFFVGSAGVLLMDLYIFVQFWIYSKGEMGGGLLVGDPEGRRWRRASGWMRGWMPTPSNNPSPEVPVTLENEDGEVGSGVVVADDEGKSRWLRVGGVRGWILNRRRRSTGTVESESETDPLVQRRKGKRRDYGSVDALRGI